ncbi:hypothetical protein Haur_5235 (plasmid) [Herpetosiphon aurantiacus DSM 785]|uniref:Uncharacterized protein n=1 Tax=Herpetosiphon aurantiacus (strain ATCC 23779 / DSM 785 / 114-95) TaxID=316274 RepID=A9B948_HERA2|nr:hypothetical protein Haur_5235 [Herpetosiphon aurantiacus DSM 785]
MKFRAPQQRIRLPARHPTVILTRVVMGIIIVTAVSLGWRLVHQPGPLVVPHQTATRTAPAAGYRLYTWTGGLQVLLVLDGPGVEDRCEVRWHNQIQVYHCWIVFDDETVLRWMLWSGDGRRGWVEADGQRYALPDTGTVMRIRANGAHGVITMLDRALPKIAAGTETKTIAAWMARDPELAPLATRMR